MTKQTETVTLKRKDEGRLKMVGGSQFDHFNNAAINQALNSLWLKQAVGEEREQLIHSALEAMMGIAPQDEVEGMLAAQMVAVHNAAMECYRRAMLPEQSFEGRGQTLSFANKLSRTFAIQMEALQRYRGKTSQQKVTVEHVHVHAGGQAIVGHVAPSGGGGGNTKSKEQPHAKGSNQLDHQPAAPMPPMPCTNPAGEAMPIARDA